MSTHNICFYGEIRKMSVSGLKKLLLWSHVLENNTSFANCLEMLHIGQVTVIVSFAWCLA